MEKMFPDLKVASQKIRNRKKDFSKTLCDLDCCISYYINRLFRCHSCQEEKCANLAEIIRLFKNIR